jgi:hypothetical protein
MARQSLRERRPRYQDRAQQEFDRYQKLLRRQEIRLHRGDYFGFLDEKELKTVRALIRSALVIVIHGYKVVVTKTSALDKSRQAYFKICRVIRIAGSRAPKPKLPVKVILRKHESPES